VAAVQIRSMTPSTRPGWGGIAPQIDVRSLLPDLLIDSLNLEVSLKNSIYTLKITQRVTLQRSLG
jgi:hypothetical protein